MLWSMGSEILYAPVHVVRVASRRMAETDQFHDHHPLYSLQRCNDNQGDRLGNFCWQEAFRRNEEHHSQYG